MRSLAAAAAAAGRDRITALLVMNEFHSRRSTNSDLRHLSAAGGAPGSATDERAAWRDVQFRYSEVQLASPSSSSSSRRRPSAVINHVSISADQPRDAPSKHPSSARRADIVVFR